MPDYQSMYYELAAKVADAIELLQEAMREGEALYMLGMDASAAEENGRKDERLAHS